MIERWTNHEPLYEIWRETSNHEELRIIPITYNSPIDPDLAPFYFSPDDEIPVQTAVMSVSKEQWDDLEKLPDGWYFQDLVKIYDGSPKFKEFLEFSKSEDFKTSDLIDNPMTRSYSYIKDNKVLFTVNIEEL